MGRVIGETMGRVVGETMGRVVGGAMGRVVGYGCGGLEISCKEGVGHGIGKESGWTVVGVVWACGGDDTWEDAVD